MSIYTDCIEAGIEVANHASDLYVPDTPEVRAILKKHNSKNHSTFRDNITGNIWLDVPFCYDPYWEAKLKR